MTEPKRCAGCGAVAACGCVTCPICHKPRLRALSEEERRIWQRHADLDAETRGRCVAVQCGIL